MTPAMNLALKGLPILPAILAATFLLPLAAQVETEKPPTEPEVISIFPLGGRQGATVDAEIRGMTLAGAYALSFGTPSLSAEVQKVEEIELDPGKGYGDRPKKRREGHRLSLRVHVAPQTESGSHTLRVITPRGVSNTLTFFVTSDPVVEEMEDPHDRSGKAQPINFPVAVNGKIGRPGEVDFYAFESSAGQELTFEVLSKTEGVSFIGQGGFDPHLTLYDSVGSWFSAERPRRLAFDDDPSSENITTSPKLTYRFAKDGRYLIRVGSFLGKGNPDSSYQLRITPPARLESSAGQKPAAGSSAPQWIERSFERKLRPDRLDQLWARTASEPAPEAGIPQGGSKGVVGESPAGTRPNPVDLAADKIAIGSIAEQEPNDVVSDALEVAVPAIIEGAIQSPGDVDSFRFSVKVGDRLAFEVETPDSLLPHFNPRLGVSDSDGNEFLVNIHKRISRNFTFYLKTVEPKTIYTFKLGGEYYLRVRDITSRYGDASFKYRILIRPQVPHVGVVEVKEERINLVAGEAKKLTVTTAQEESFTGDIAVSLQGLPPGVQAIPGTQVEPDKGPPLDEGYKERFLPKKEKVVILLVADAKAPATRLPTSIRVLARPVVDGKLGEQLAVQQIPLMVISPPVEAPEGKVLAAKSAGRDD